MSIQTYGPQAISGPYGPYGPQRNYGALGSQDPPQQNSQESIEPAQSSRREQRQARRNERRQNRIARRNRRRGINNEDTIEIAQTTPEQHPAGQPSNTNNENKSDIDEPADDSAIHDPERIRDLSSELLEEYTVNQDDEEETENNEIPNDELHTIPEEQIITLPADAPDPTSSEALELDEEINGAVERIPDPVIIVEEVLTPEIIDRTIFFTAVDMIGLQAFKDFIAGVDENFIDWMIVEAASRYADGRSFPIQIGSNGKGSSELERFVEIVSRVNSELQNGNQETNITTALVERTTAHIVDTEFPIEEPIVVVEEEIDESIPTEIIIIQQISSLISPQRVQDYIEENSENRSLENLLPDLIKVNNGEMSRFPICGSSYGSRIDRELLEIVEILTAIKNEVPNIDVLTHEDVINVTTEIVMRDYAPEEIEIVEIEEDEEDLPYNINQTILLTVAAQIKVGNVYQGIVNNMYDDELVEYIMESNDLTIFGDNFNAERPVTDDIRYLIQYFLLPIKAALKSNISDEEIAYVLTQEEIETITQEYINAYIQNQQNIEIAKNALNTMINNFVTLR
ncbi:hypothetical protein ACFL56_03590 [Candidatus Margulisiibacteriota bacterium]